MRLLSLDLLRAIAVFLVLMWHWLPETHELNFLMNGPLGVIIFFVLSGYLITKGLLNSKASSLITLKTFYFNRFLRIFPLYYIVLIIISIVGYHAAIFVPNQFWYWFYGVNIYEQIGGEIVPYTHHLWSLSVEEQFYLVWPLTLVVFTKKKISNNCKLIILLILSLLFSFTYDFVTKLPYLHTLRYFFCFSVGALVAVNKERLGDLNLRWILLGSLILNVGIKLSFRFGIVDYKVFYTSIVDCFLAFSLVLVALKLNTQHYLNFRVVKWIAHIGKISYGVYLFHYFVYPLNHSMHLFCIEHGLKIPFTNYVLIPEFGNIYIRFIYFFLFTIVLAQIAYSFIEKPLLRFKLK